MVGVVVVVVDDNVHSFQKKLKKSHGYFGHKSHACQGVIGVLPNLVLKASGGQSWDHDIHTSVMDSTA